MGRLILTLTINPAIDRNVSADRLAFDDRGYILSTDETAGGRGVNASRVVHSFGGRTLAILPSGGRAGSLLERSLATLGFPYEVVRIKHEIRTNLTITDRQGLTVKLNEFGPPIGKSALEQLQRAVRLHLPKAKWLLICGSLPPGVPPAVYSRLVTLARKQGVKTLLDTDGDALLAGLEAGPTVVTPNQNEAERLLNRVLITPTHALEAAERIQAMGAESVMLSLGSRGAICVRHGVRLEVRPPLINAVCPIGAGDALSAAFAWASMNGSDFADASRWGVAAGTAKAKLPGMEFATLEQTLDVYRHVEVHELVPV